jgi:tRNA(adenine34) deaminase
MYDDNYFMNEALKEAQKAFDAEEVPVGAVIVANNKIIARGHNLTERLTDVTAHAEMQAITAAAHALGGKYLHECTLYVTLEPCPMCAGALNWAQITRVVYGASDPKRGFTIHSQQMLHLKTSVVLGIQEQACSELIKRFFNSKR